MVIRLGDERPQMGPQRGPEPAWATYTRTPGQSGSLRLRARKPDVAAYRVLGTEPQRSLARDVARGMRERNRHNSSVYVADLDRYAGRKGVDLARLPVVGEIAAGQYDVTVAYQEYDCLGHENGVMVEKALARGGGYALRVRGTSMTHVGIEPGDVVIVRPQTWAENGDFVVANYVEGEAGGSEGLATLKRFYRRRDHVFLQSATAATDPIRLFPKQRPGASDPDPVKVQGVVTMVLKAGRA